MQSTTLGREEIGALEKRTSEVSQPVGVFAADLVLRFSTFLFSAGLAIALLTRKGSAIGGVALMDWGISHDTIFLFEKIGSFALLGLATVLLIFPSILIVLLIAGIAFAEAYAGYYNGGYAFFELTLFAQALRYLAPLALVPLVVSRSVFKAEKLCRWTAEWILRIGLAVVFFTHGFEALGKNPVFVDLILGSARTFGISMTEASAGIALTIIAWVDFAVAGLTLFRLSRPLLGWLCFWGLITALSRPISLGLASYPEVLLRAPHFLAPVALWFLVIQPRARRQKASDQTRSSAGSAIDLSSSLGSERTG